MASIFDIYQAITNSRKKNKVGTIESMLSGVASGLIAIPKGFFSLGASLMDLGVNSGKAASCRSNGLMILQNLMRKQKQQLLVKLQKH